MVASTPATLEDRIKYWDAEVKKMEESDELKDKQIQAQEVLQTKSLEQRAGFDQKLEDKVNKAKKEQLEARDKAQASSEMQKAAWEAENKAHLDAYDEQVEKRSHENRQQIDQQVAATQAEAENKMNAAKTEADAKIQEANARAAEEKKKAEEDKSWWDQATDFVSSVFESLKAALNTIFDGLRAVVKTIMKAVKNLVVSLIETARLLVVSLIKAFGEVLKGLVNVLLVAFPSVAKKFCALIDKAINLAVEAVNKIAEGLKAVVSFLIDALASALDSILAAYQAIYNAILDALEFIAVGMVKILKGLLNIAKSLGPFAMNIFGDVQKEILGQDVTSPLPNIESSHKELPILEQMKASISGSKMSEPTEVKEVQQSEELGKKSKLAKDDMHVADMKSITLDKELVNKVAEQLKGQETLELGGANPAVNAEDLKINVLQAGNSSNTEKQASENGENINEALNPEVIANLKKPDQEKIDENIAKMSEVPPPSDAKKTEGNKKPEPIANPATQAEISKRTGRLSIGQRLAFTGRQMLAGFQMLWQKYKVHIIAGLLALLTLAIFTGGSILTLIIPPALNFFTAYFAATAILKIKDKLEDWLKLSWAGNYKAGGKALSEAIAILFAEFLLEYVLKGLGKAWKSAKKGMKATKLGRAARKGMAVVKKTARSAKKAVKKTTKKAIKGVKAKAGKYVLKFKKGFGKGAKKIGDLRKKILDKFGFKKLWFKRKGRKIQLWGEFNSVVLIQEVDEDGKDQFDLEDVSSKKIRDQLGDNQILGKEVNVNGNKGYVVADSGNTYSKGIDESNISKKYDELNHLDDAGRRKKIEGGEKDRVSLRKEVEEEIWKEAFKRFDFDEGKFIDPNTKELIPFKQPLETFPKGHPCHPHYKPRADIGHKPGNEWRNRREMHKESGSTREEIIETENDSSLYWIEDRTNNRSHKHEK